MQHGSQTVEKVIEGHILGEAVPPGVQLFFLLNEKHCFEARTCGQRYWRTQSLGCRVACVLHACCMYVTCMLHVVACGGMESRAGLGWAVAGYARPRPWTGLCPAMGRAWTSMWGPCLRHCCVLLPLLRKGPTSPATLLPILVDVLCHCTLEGLCDRF